MADASNPVPALVDRVREAIEDLRPQIQTHGGDIEFIGVEQGTVQVRLTGACSGCPHAAMTLQMGVERYLRQMVPEIQGVVNVA